MAGTPVKKHQISGSTDESENTVTSHDREDVVRRTKEEDSDAKKRRTRENCSLCAIVICKYVNRQFLGTHIELESVNFRVTDIESLRHDDNKGIGQQSLPYTYICFWKKGKKEVANCFILIRKSSKIITSSSKHELTLAVNLVLNVCNSCLKFEISRRYFYYKEQKSMLLYCRAT